MKSQPGQEAHDVTERHFLKLKDEKGKDDCLLIEIQWEVFPFYTE